ncbi:MAG: hypothetical protein INH41_24155 [Myxococcaceae bacterium]|jgi:hypothetical protein|nr:hypothetical protein [Myxococcaceae bacterium]
MGPQTSTSVTRDLLLTPEHLVPLSQEADVARASTSDESPLPSAAIAADPTSSPSTAAPLSLIALPHQKPAATSPATDDFGTKSDDVKGPREREARTAAADGTAPQPAKAPLILELAAQRLAPTPEPKRARSEGQSPSPHEPQVAGLERKREPERDDASALSRPPVAALPLEPSAPARIEVPPAAPPLHAVTPAMLEDPALRVIVLPNVARVNVDTGDQGSVSLQVKVQDGVADVRATGPAASLIEARQGELRVALASEGLSLGQFDLGQSDSGGRRERFETAEERELAPRRAPLRATTTTTRTDGRLSVKA